MSDVYYCQVSVCAGFQVSEAQICSVCLSLLPYVELSATSPAPCLPACKLLVMLSIVMIMDDTSETAPVENRRVSDER